MFYVPIVRFTITLASAQESLKSPKIIIHNMSLLSKRFVQKEFRIFMKIEFHFYRNEICLTALFIPSCANAFKPNQLSNPTLSNPTTQTGGESLSPEISFTPRKKYAIKPIGKKTIFF